ncbi:hypothetical protein ZIOFF_001882 [Zingiber officinale]|uniref:Uncharacterized protein n=1 Tax=Zingiber officinale TaxID=94328 RepID=A0A8J5INZ1_ZINOF|nr:hypothetical protein ZIOFF_001882 [Zingiber officinale]
MCSGHSNKSRVVVIIVVPLLPTFFLAAAVIPLWRRRKTRNNKMSEESLDEEEAVEEENLDMSLFDLRRIAEAIGDFYFDNKLRDGGFGPFYKGKLKEGQEIAMKRLLKTLTYGSDEFKNEMSSPSWLLR